ncbi:MAG: LacI family transcriptional regulator [Ruminococcaceae bacterium]|nr:LacI family transcriptional regulator [Oscillospiraceae bacterium]
MNNKKITDLASKYNVSITTVSKVIRHCSAVDTNTRQRILNEIQAHSPSDCGCCDIYCILPDVPHYFWGELRRSFDEYSPPRDIAVKLNIYTHLIDEETVLHYLSEAEKMNAAVIILSTHITKRIHDKLNILLPGRLIILLSEQYPFTNGFYIGSDPFSDGYAMGKLYTRKLSCNKLGVLRLSVDHNAEKRLSGFLSALKESDSVTPSEVISVTDETYSEKTAAAHIANLLSMHRDTIDCIYSPFGIPRLPLAVRKAELKPHTILLAHDTFTDFDAITPPKGFHAVCNQSLYTQGSTALSLAETFIRTGRYPPTKNTYVPSVIRTAD